MPRGGAHFTSKELTGVLTHYDIGTVQKTTPLSAGNRRAPKMIITASQGKFLIKRRPKGKDDIYRVAFSHAVQHHLLENGFPVATLIPTADDKSTVLQRDGNIYECFEFIEGTRYDGSPEATIDTGRKLAQFHSALSDFACEWSPLKGSFHDSTTVRRHLKTIGIHRTKPSTPISRKLQSIGESLMPLYNASSVHVNELGFDSWPQQVIHGDWHPGNMLFIKNRLIAVIDYDSAKIAPPITDLANGMLQFSIVASRPNPAEWPDYLDQKKFMQFLNGYREIIDLDNHKLEALLDLMIETIIAEAILPIAATGYFGNLAGIEFLLMIRRKARWLHKNKTKLLREMKHP